jgi:hypothetical protein
MHTTLQPVRIGHRNGIDWVCYRLPSDTDADYELRVEQMREAFAAGMAGR